MYANPFQLIKEFKTWQSSLSGGKKLPAHAAQEASHVRAILSKIPFSVSTLNVAQNEIEDKWLTPILEHSTKKAKTVKNYLFSLSRFLVFLQHRHQEDFPKAQPLESAIKNWRAALKPKTRKEDFELKAKQKR